MLNIFIELKNNRDFSPNEKIVANYILQHPDMVLNMNTKQLSEVCFVSPATIYRLCDKLNLSGYSELKVKISGSIGDYMKNLDNFNYDFPVKQYQTHYEIIHKLKEDYENTITSTSNLFRLEQLKAITHALKKAKHIDIYTSAGNIYFAQNFMFQMLEIGVHVNVPVEEYHQRLLASTSDETHFAIVISFEGRGILANSILKILKGNGVPILLISSYEYQSKHIKPDYQLFISPYENHYKKISSFSTRLSILYILDVIYTCYFELDYNKNIDKKLKFYKTMG